MRSGVALALEILFFAPLSIVTKQNLFIYMELDAQHCVESIAHTIGAAASALCVARSRRYASMIWRIRLQVTMV